MAKTIFPTQVTEEIDITPTPTEVITIPPMLTIYQAMALILADIDAIGKDRKADMGNAGKYNFRGIDDMYNALHRSFAKYKVFILPEVLENQFEVQVKEKEYNKVVTKSLQYSCILKVKFTFLSEDGSSVSGIGIGHALDTSDKATNKAQSSALKYCLMQTFLIPTEEVKDVEADNNTPAKPAIVTKDFTNEQITQMLSLATETDFEPVYANFRELHAKGYRATPAQGEDLKNAKAIWDKAQLQPKATEPATNPLETPSMRPLTTPEFETLLSVFTKGGVEGLKAELETVNTKYTISPVQRKSLETITQTKLF